MENPLPRHIEAELKRLGVIDAREIEEPDHDPQEDQTRRIVAYLDEHGEPLF